MEAKPIIEFSQISKSFGKKTVLKDINLKIFKGEILALIGRSGSGKSTLMKLLLGIYPPNQGRLFYDTLDITTNPQALRTKVGLTTQENSFYDRLTIYENMIYYANLYSRHLPKEDIVAILDAVELGRELNTLAGKLSGGMKRRLDFALSLVHNPTILILDEPTTGLDPLLVEQFWAIIRKVAKGGKTVIVISHIFPEIEQYCDRACILNKGSIAKIVQITRKTHLFAEFCKEVSDGSS